MKKYIPRIWPILLASAIIFQFVFQDFDLLYLQRFLTFFSVFVLSGYGALWCFWVERTAQIELDADIKTQASYDNRAIARDISYAVMVTGSIIAAASLSM